MVFGLFRSKSDDRPARIYARAVEAARNPALYDRFSVPDTVDGRMEMVMLHTGLVVSRLSATDGDRDLARDVSEAFFADMEGSLRELGISDIAVPKKMKKVASAFYGRLQAYGEAADEAALTAALSRNVHGGADHPTTPALARYVRTLAAVLRDADAAAVIEGRATVPEPQAFLDQET